VQLTPEQLKKIEEDISNGREIRYILGALPDAEITILMGCEEDPGPGYRDAYFDVQEARKESARLSSIWGTPSNPSHYVIQARVGDFVRGEIIDPRTKMRFIDMDGVYRSLQRHLE
jgi:hypothetical protein